MCIRDRGYTFAIVDNEILCREIDEQNHDFTAIIGIDGSRRIQYSNSMLQSQTAAISSRLMSSMKPNVEPADTVIRAVSYTHLWLYVQPVNALLEEHRYVICFCCLYHISFCCLIAL